MKQELMKILACPLCKGHLELVVSRDDRGEILEGALSCARCSQTYPIEGGIPNLLPPDLRD